MPRRLPSEATLQSNAGDYSKLLVPGAVQVVESELSARKSGDTNSKFALAQRLWFWAGSVACGPGPPIELLPIL